MPYENESIQTECRSKSRVKDERVDAADVRLVYLLLVHEQVVKDKNVSNPRCKHV